MHENNDNSLNKDFKIHNQSNLDTIEKGNINIERVEDLRISNIVTDMNSVALNKHDIYSVIMELFDDFTDDPQIHASFDKYWNNAKFIELISEQGQMSIVSGIQAVTLAEHIPFSRLIDYYFKDHQLDKKLMQISLIFKEREHLIDFIFYFRKELFSNIYYSNLKLQQLTLLDSQVLDDRLQYFFRKNTHERK